MLFADYLLSTVSAKILNIIRTMHTFLSYSQRNFETCNRTYKDVLYRMATDVGDLKQLILWQSITSGHDNLSHQRIERTWSALWLRCYWPEIFSWVKGDSKNCQRCVVANMPQPVVWTLLLLDLYKFRLTNELPYSVVYPKGT